MEGEDSCQQNNQECRPIKSLLRFVGGKSRLAAQIVERIPPHLAYVEPFAGGAWVFFQKQPSKVEVLNDLDGELVNFWRVIQNHPWEFFNCCARLIPSRELFEWERHRDTAGLTDIQRASRYYYLQRLAFGGQMRNLNFGTSSIRPPGFHLAELRTSLPAIERRLQRVLIENLDAVECIRRYDRATTLFYVDPPYWGERKYTLSLESTDYDRLARELKQIKGIRVGNPV